MKYLINYLIFCHPTLITFLCRILQGIDLYKKIKVIYLKRTIYLREF